MADAKRVLVLSPYPREGASVRFRVLQFLPEMTRAGLEISFVPFMSSTLFRIRRRFGLPASAAKALLALRDGLVLLARVLLEGWRCRTVLVHREACPFGPPVLERLLAAAGRRIVYDLDDSIYSPPTAGVNQRVLSGPGKYHALLAMADRIVVGNATLAEYAGRFNDPARVTVIPTGVDTDRWRPLPRTARAGPVVIGWVGNWGNAFYLQTIREALATLSRERAFVLKLVGGDDVLDIDLPCQMVRVRWSLEREVEDLADVDIGIMPLLGGAYDEGKCGFKIIQFFAMEAPVVATPVGVNGEIVRPGVNGFLAGDAEQWVSCLRRLIDHPDERRAMGEAGRRLVEERFSSRVLAPQLTRTLAP